MKSENGGAGHVIGAMLERFREKEPPVPGENEYIGENGLLFCSVCRTPKQCRVNILGYQSFRQRLECWPIYCKWTDGLLRHYPQVRGKARRSDFLPGHLQHKRRFARWNLCRRRHDDPFRRPAMHWLQILAGADVP